MANRYLLPLYKALYDKDFSYSDFNQRMEMQKAVYLLQDLGVPVGDYGFRWYLHGPYSQKLQDDMYYEDGRPVAQFSLSDEYAGTIRKLHEIIHSDRRGKYSTSHWVECLASLRYLRKNVLSFNTTKDDVLAQLEQRKTHLNNRAVNAEAYDMLQDLFA